MKYVILVIATLSLISCSSTPKQTIVEEQYTTNYPAYLPRSAGDVSNVTVVFNRPVQPVPFRVDQFQVAQYQAPHRFNPYDAEYQHHHRYSDPDNHQHYRERGDNRSNSVTPVSHRPTPVAPVHQPKQPQQRVQPIHQKAPVPAKNTGNHKTS